MKAFLLAAGKGTRLRPLTNASPKCLLPICGEPLLNIWLTNIAMAGVDEVLINLHHLPQQVVDFVKSYGGKLKIVLSYEESLLGSAGTVRENRQFIGNDSEFLIAYSDNLTKINLTEMLAWHTKTNGLFTMGVFKTPTPRECGIVEMGVGNLVIGFEEKPQKPRSNLANAGIYVASTKILEYIPARIPCDFGYDVIPELVGIAKAYIINEFIMDIGTLDAYNIAQKLWLEMKPKVTRRGNAK